MSKRVIAVDLEGTEVRVAILQLISGKIEVALEQRQAGSAEETADLLRDMLAGKMTLTDRVVTALPARLALFRRLPFPFREKRKIEAALPLAFSAQLPISLEDQVLAFLPPQAVEEGGYEVDAVAVNRQKISDILACFPEPQQNPGRIDLMPFALLPALGDRAGFLVCCRATEVVVALISAGRVEEYRLLPVAGDMSDEDVTGFVSQQLSRLGHGQEHDGLPLWLVGSGVSDHLRRHCEASGRAVEPLATEVFGADLPAAMAPVALLALGELREKKNSGRLNFRQGEFVARGQWEMLRSKLIIAAIMVLLIGVGSGLSMYLNYQQKSSEQAQLAQQMTRLFQQVMPAGSVVVDMPLQLENYRQQLQAQVQMFGLDGKGAVAVLQELSRAISTDLRVELQDFNYSDGEARISGYADSFDAVNQITEMLVARSLFQEVTIANARLATDNVRVDFELQLRLATGGEQ